MRGKGAFYLRVGGLFPFPDTPKDAVEDMATQDNSVDEQGRRPIPDPTVLTTDQLLREIAHTKELAEVRIAYEAKLADQRASLVEGFRIESKADGQRALEAALAAQKDSNREQAASFAAATTKSESAFADQLRQIVALSSTDNANVLTQLGDIKERIGKIENIKLGGLESQTQRRDGLAMIVSVAAIIVTILLAIAGAVIAAVLS